MANFDVDMAYQDLLEVIPELKIFNMHRTYVSNIVDCYDPDLLQRYDSMGSLRSSQYDSPVHSQNLSEWVKTSIMGDYNPASFDYVPEHSSSSRGQTDLLVYKAQQLIAQPRSFDDCTCSSYSSDAPNCTCDAVKTENSKPSVGQDLASVKQNYQRTQDGWLNNVNFNRMQKEKQTLFQSLVVPDPSNEYPFYMNYDGSIYDQELNQSLPLPNQSTPEMQRVPGEATYNVPSPITSPGPNKPKTSRPRLCHFLLELLANPAQYSDIIEWVDKEKGVFKFLNSAEVASNWGRRRNKPHMKYENFARSLRTYIAKGILTKPRSKLVYRFTNKFY